MRLRARRLLAHRYGINRGHPYQYPVVLLALDLDKIIPENRSNRPTEALPVDIEHEAFAFFLTELEQILKHSRPPFERSNPPAPDAGD
jgi:hypothetical protein